MYNADTCTLFNVLIQCVMCCDTCMYSTVVWVFRWGPVQYGTVITCCSMELKAYPAGPLAPSTKIQIRRATCSTDFVQQRSGLQRASRAELDSVS
ncbi:hypothetical protein PF010_g26494 [Phytophthora fragariae]|uniref:Secreted protein n=1 Tax=Phytophthora fragariae TaxID=53985 RepID=A0A6G0JWJ6_9STRA|nr:hypothetical protein PF010_g26494 [Phytophthora fragariae]KAE9176424.1 hypothetical protein PF004_g26096 [Phytophthora fragariae]KAE9286298.1 hypothetical protein PF008_g26697 [Phytophthora fragariae]